MSRNKIALCATVIVASIAASAALASGIVPAVHPTTGAGMILAQATTPPPAATSQIPTQSGQSGADGSGMQPVMPGMAGRMRGMGMNMQEMGRRMEQQGQTMQQSGTTVPPNVDPAKMGMGMDKMEMGMKDMGGAMGPCGM